MIITPEDVVLNVLKQIPGVDDGQVYHQLEYLRVRLENGSYQLKGSCWGEEPHLIGPFAGMEDTIFPRIQKALDGYFKERFDDLIRRVSTAMLTLMKQSFPPTHLWLDNRKRYPIKDQFLNMRVRYHNNDEEFVVSFAHERIVMLGD